MRLSRARSGFRLAWPAAALWTFACATASKPPDASGEGADLAAVVEGIQQALREAGSRPVAGFPPWKSVTVKLQTEATRSAGGEIQVYVVSLGSRYTAESVSSIELKFGVEVTGAGGAKVAFVPLAADVSAKLGKNQVQTITLVFEK